MTVLRCVADHSPMYSGIGEIKTGDLVYIPSSVPIYASNSEGNSVKIKHLQEPEVGVFIKNDESKVGSCMFGEFCRIFIGEKIWYVDKTHVYLYNKGKK